MSGLSRSRVGTRAARVDDLPSVLALVRQYRADAHVEGVLTGQTALGAAAAGFRRLLGDDTHRVVLAVLPGPNAGAGLDGTAGELAAGLAVLGIEPLSQVLGCPQVTVDTFVGHEAERQRYFAQMGFAPLTTRRVVARESLARTLAARLRGGVTVPVPRRAAARRRTMPTVPVPRLLPGPGTAAMLEAVSEG